MIQNYTLRRAMLDALPGLLEQSKAEYKQSKAGLDSLWDEKELTDGEENYLKGFRLEITPQRLALNALKGEKDALGVYISGHPVDWFPGLIEAAHTPVSTLRGWYQNTFHPVDDRGYKRCVLVGMITDVERKQYGGFKTMTKFVLSDATGRQEMTYFGKDFKTLEPKFNHPDPVMLICSVKLDGESLKVSMEKIYTVDELDALPKAIYIELDQNNGYADVNTVSDILEYHPGNLATHLRVKTSQSNEHWVLEGRHSAEVVAHIAGNSDTTAKLIVDANAVLNLTKRKGWFN
jgi:DNA polymerase III subunit alpha